jgi:hypothetical protein
MEEKTNAISKTSLYGLLSNIFLAIALQPDLVNFLPLSMRDYVKGLAILGTVVFRQMGSINTADVAHVKKNTEDLQKIKEDASEEITSKRKLETFKSQPPQA